MVVHGAGSFYVKRFLHMLGMLSILWLSTNDVLKAVPQYNLYDPAIMHTTAGLNKFYKHREKAEFSLTLSPFYQHTSSASQQLGINQQNGTSNKVPLGNRLGRWNMAALYFNPADAIPSNSPLAAAKTKIITAEGVVAAQSITYQTGQNFNLDGTNEASTAATFAAVRATYERLGLRGQIGFDFAFGLGIGIKGGVIDYKQTPTFVPILPTVTAAASGSGTTSTIVPFANDPAKTISAQLTTQGQREAIAQQFNLDLSEQRLTTLEDTHVDLHWSIPVKCYDNDEFSFNLVPLLSVGVWVPTGQATDQNKAFSVPTGNDGFAGGTIDVGLNFDFPKMLQLGFGCGAAFFGTRTLNDQRVPTSPLQVGIIPWKTTIAKRPGALWYFNASLKAEQFDSGFSCYLDYIFTQHIKDSITLQEVNPARLAQFQKGVKSMEDQSVWKAQHLNAGLKYNITSLCALSVGFQGYISGVRTYRLTTVMGSFSILL